MGWARAHIRFVATFVALCHTTVWKEVPGVGVWRAVASLPNPFLSLCGNGVVSRWGGGQGGGGADTHSVATICFTPPRGSK